MKSRTKRGTRIEIRCLAFYLLRDLCELSVRNLFALLAKFAKKLALA
jgi:hypothetical protein